MAEWYVDPVREYLKDSALRQNMSAEQHTKQSNEVRQTTANTRDMRRN